MSNYVYKLKDAFPIMKHGVELRIYDTEDNHHAAAVYQESSTGHAEEFLHRDSAFIFYIIEGQGTYYVAGEPHFAEGGDVIIIPPSTRFYYQGRFKQICFTVPPWREDGEEHVRFVDFDQK